MGSTVQFNHAWGATSTPPLSIFFHSLTVRQQRNSIDCTLGLWAVKIVDPSGSVYLILARPRFRGNVLATASENHRLAFFQPSVLFDGDGSGTTVLL